MQQGQSRLVTVRFARYADVWLDGQGILRSISLALPPEEVMPLVKVLRSGQVTLPTSIREKLQLKQGDYLEAEVVEQGLLLKPARGAADRRGATSKVMEIVRQRKWRGPGPEPTDDEVMKMVIEEIHAMRHEDDQSGSR